MNTKEEKGPKCHLSFFRNLLAMAVALILGLFSQSASAAILTVSPTASSKNILAIQETSPAVMWFIEEVNGPTIDYHISLTFDSQLTFQSQALPEHWSFQESVFGGQKTVRYFYQGTDSGVANENFDLATPWTSEYFLIDSSGGFGASIASVDLEVAAISVGGPPFFIVSAGSHLETLSSDVVLTAVPEPGAYALLLGVFAGFVIVRSHFEVKKLSIINRQSSMTYGDDSTKL